MQHMEFETTNNEVQRVNPDDVRHIEETTNESGMNVFILHFKSKGAAAEVLHSVDNCANVGHILSSHGYQRHLN